MEASDWCYRRSIVAKKRAERAKMVLIQRKVIVTGACDVANQYPFDGDLESERLISRIADCESICRRCEGECICKPPPSQCGENVDTMRCCPHWELFHHIFLFHDQ